jgi:hypothetical protein
MEHPSSFEIPPLPRQPWWDRIGLADYLLFRGGWGAEMTVPGASSESASLSCCEPWPWSPVHRAGSAGRPGYLGHPQGLVQTASPRGPLAWRHLPRGRGRSEASLMRIAVLGAMGATGLRVARDLLERSDVTDALLLDSDPETLGRLSAQLGKRRARTAGLGLSVPPLAEALAGCDIAIGTLPRDLKLERTALRAAIHAGVPYLTACQSPEMVEALLSHDAEARNARIPIVVGAGWTSGVSNLLAVGAGGLLDRVLRVRVAWVVPPPGPQAAGLVAGGLQALSGKASVYREGRRERRQAGSERQKVFFPEPVGWAEVGLASSAEAITLPRRFDGVEEVVVKGGVTGRGLPRLGPRPSWGRRRPVLLPRPRGKKSLKPAGGGMRSIPWASVRVDVSGTVAEAHSRLTYGVVDEIGKLVSASLIGGALVLAGTHGREGAAGVGPLEAFIEPGPFFALLGEQGVRVARLER